MALRFAGKHAVVVGATGHLGQHIARAFAASGAAVSSLGRTAVQLRSELEPQLEAHATHRFIRLDVADRPSIRDVFKEHVGPLDILVNCAGIAQTTLLRRTSDEGLASVIDTNLLATILICKHAMVKPSGCIINVSSLMAARGDLGVTAYAASKAGVVAFTRNLCRELAARSIRVNALLPGWVESSMWRDLTPKLQQDYLKDTPLNRVGHPSEVADAAIFLAANEFANNCVLNLDGGLSAA